MATEKKPKLTDLKNEIKETLKKLDALESNLRTFYPDKDINSKELRHDLEFYCKDVSTEISPWDNIDVTITTNNGIRITFNLNYHNAQTLWDYLDMDIKELDERENQSENNEEESNDEED